MNTNKLQNMFAQITKCDMYTQLAVLGSWSFSINAACINAAAKFVPDGPVSNGLEEFTPYEAARRKMISEAESSYLPALLALQRELAGMINEADGQARELEDTFQFLTERAGPTREQFSREYDERNRLGMRPGMSRRQFVDHEFERASAAHNQLIAKGEDAVRLCNTVTVEDGRGFNDLPEWVAESFERKMLEKLHNRWEKLEMNRTNPRRQKAIRDASAADQRIIESVLAEYGQQPAFDETPDPSDVQIMREEEHKSLADMPNDLLDDPRKPGVVTITKFVRAPAPTE